MRDWGRILKQKTWEFRSGTEKTERKINCPDGTLKLIAIPTQDGFHGCSCLIHRHAFEDVGLFDERLRLLNDMDLWFRFYTSGYIVHFVPKVLVYGRVHSKQVSRSVGFSYHNAEQDMFWSRSLDWLKQNCPNNYDVFYLFGRTAFLKTRTDEGHIAFSIAGKIRKKQKVVLAVCSILFRCYAFFKQYAKKLYLKIFT